MTFALCSGLFCSPAPVSMCSMLCCILTPLLSVCIWPIEHRVLCFDGKFQRLVTSDGKFLAIVFCSHVYAGADIRLVSLVCSSVQAHECGNSSDLGHVCVCFAAVCSATASFRCSPASSWGGYGMHAAYTQSGASAVMLVCTSAGSECLGML